MATEQQVKDYWFGLIGKREGDPADDYRQVMQRLIDQGMQVNFVPEEQAKHNPDATFRGIKIVKDGNGTIRGNIQVPAHQRDDNGYYTHEFLVIRDRVQGQPPFVGPFDWGWHDRGGGTLYLLDEGSGGGEQPGGPGTTPPAGGMTPEQVQAMIDAALVPIREELATALKLGDAIALESDNGMILCAEGGGPNGPDQRFVLTSRLAINSWETWRLRKGKG